MFDTGTTPVALLQRVGSAARAEACAAGERLSAIGELFALRRGQSEETADWAIDAEAAVCAEVSAVLSISPGLAASHLRYARALREQLPLLGRALIAGDIDEATFRTCVFRTGLILDDEVMASVDQHLAVTVPRWGVLNRSQLAGRIDRVVAGMDVDAVRRRRDRIADREVVIGDVDRGLAEIHATLFAPDAHAVGDRLTALANTVCEADPRTIAQRRADAFGVLAAGGDRVGCGCGQSDSPAGGRAASAVVIHVIAEAATLDGTRPTPGMMVGFEGLIPPEMITELARSARMRPLIHPRDAAPEEGYVPSRALADFVRHRDLTCRFPGCDVPATRCDIDHSIPHAAGGPTHASNLSCKCRLHHLLKTFWGWRDEQLRDGTLIWTSPTGDRYVSAPGSAVIFPGLCEPTGPVALTPTADQRCGDRTVMMPKRHRTRDQDRATKITTERQHNHQMLSAPTTPEARYDEDLDYEDTFPDASDSSPPPF
jgi:hypothetical protein